MSKLQKLYEELKKKDKNKVYIFKVGIFYNILNEDAKVVSNAIGLKLTDLGPNLIKCGFPVSALDKYTLLLKSKKINFEIISTIASPTSQNISYISIINKIKNLDMNNTTYKQAFDLIYNIQQKLKNMQ